MNPVQVVEVLNRIHKADPTVLPALIEQRVPCNQAVADDPTVQVGRALDGTWEVGFLGILNGALGIREDGYGHITALTSKETGEILRFELTDRIR